MKAYIFDGGEPEVGIRSTEITVVFPDRFKLPGPRNLLKKHLKEFGEHFLDGVDFVRFSDECPDCGAEGYIEGTCSNTHCISNMIDPDETEGP